MLQRPRRKLPLTWAVEKYAAILSSTDKEGLADKKERMDDRTGNNILVRPAAFGETVEFALSILVAKREAKDLSNAIHNALISVPGRKRNPFAVSLRINPPNADIIKRRVGQGHMDKYTALAIASDECG
mmetsp:Transcript_13813/g.39709  ORF Transcript_13813/g.39709 Transcript_13813/m.39709 type:complete len:129 (+) Transcript_13813:840-1226(+)